MTDWALVFATLIGPILAVQAQKWNERGRKQRNKQVQIFHILMATRAVRAGLTEHVQALNSIDLLFDKKSRKEKPVVESRNIYFDHVHDLREAASIEEIKQWNIVTGSLLVELLSQLSAYLGYDFDEFQLKRGVYFPKNSR